MSDDSLRRNALDYHRADPPGKLAISATKPLGTQRDLALAYSPGVAAACEAIAADPAEAAGLTTRANLIAVVSNGTAVLGLGAIGPLASKPVMEGKAVLFKKFAGINVFDIEIDERDPDRLVDIVAALEPTFGGINLEDIKAPECFEIETRLKARMKIPVFHDDQHGTAIIVAAAICNGLRVVNKTIGTVKLVTSGAGAAGMACVDLLVSMGLRRENVWITDIAGVVYKGRTENMNPRLEGYAQDTDARSLGDVIAGADLFLGVSAPGVLTPDMVRQMADQPIIMALANPTPEILPDVARAARPDAIIATGRSDFPNQVNNVLCFPFLFRGALDCGATEINEPMKQACVKAIADLAMAEGSDVVAAAYGGEMPTFGPDYLIPKPFDPRLIVEIPMAVARAAMDSGVAQRPIADFQDYQDRLTQFVFQSGLTMKPIIERARARTMRVCFCEGEEERVLHAVQTVVDDGIARPILIGRERVVMARIRKLGLRLRRDDHFELCDPDNDPRYNAYAQTYHELLGRKGVSPAYARTIVRTNTTVIGAIMTRRGEADALIAGPVGVYRNHLAHLQDVIGLADGVHSPAALSLLVMPTGTYFITDTYVTNDPSADEIAEQTILAAEQVRRFGMTPKVALLSHSNFGSAESVSAAKMRAALTRIRNMAPELEVDGEMHGDAALSELVRQRNMPGSRLKGSANLLVMPNVDAANIALNLIKVLGNGLSVGPVLLGMAHPVHIGTTSVTVRGLVNMTALAAVDAQMARTVTDGA